MVNFLMFLAFWQNTPCSLDRIEILSQIFGKTLEEVIVELNLKRETVHLGGGIDNAWLGYCGFYDKSGNHVILWLEVPKIILPNPFLAKDLEAERHAIFKSVLNNRVKFFSVGNGKAEVSKVASVLPAINACNGKQVSEVLNDLDLKIRKKVGYYDFLNSVYLVRVLDSRNLVFEFQIDEEELPNHEGKVRYRHLKSKRFKFLRVFTGKKKNLRGYVYYLRGFN